jgi:uncharacterized surface protein with fasciclin (FAS1) repeats
MNVSIGILRKTLLSAVALSSVVALSACGQPTTDNTTTPSAAETPNTNTSPVADVPSPTITTVSPSPITPTTSPSPNGAATSNQNLGQLAEAASTQGSFTILTKAVQAAGLTSNLSAQGPYTVFAPTDDAFKALPTGTVDSLLKPENKTKLVQLLSYHVVPGRITSSQLKSGNVKTVAGTNVTVSVSGSGVTVNKAKVTQADIPASNGIVHVVDQVILPPNFK